MKSALVKIAETATGDPPLNSGGRVEPEKSCGEVRSGQIGVPALCDRKATAK